MAPDWGWADDSYMATMVSVQTRCANCRSEDLVTVRLALGGDLPVEFDFCPHCEWRGWDSAGHTLPLASVLGIAGAR